MLSQIRSTAARLHYAWIIVAITFAVVVVTAGVRATPSVLIVPLEQEFHWSRATISFAVGINLLLYGAIGPFAAAVMDRFGARRTMLLALAATAAGVALTPAMREPWQLVLLWGVVIGLSTGFIGAYLAAFIAARWFREREGLVVGILTAANAAGQLVFLPTMAALATHAGWRMMSLVLAGTVVAFLPLLALLMRDRPEDLGLVRYGEDSRSRATAAPDGNPVAVAFRALATGVRSRDFWLIAGGYFVCGATTNGLIGTHLIAACVDHGFSEVAGAGLLAATGIFALLGGTIAGWLSDRWDNRLLLFSYYGLRGLALLYLPFAFNMPFYALSVFSVVYGLDWIASAPPTVRLLIGVVGTERIGIMVAWITVIHQIGSASAAYFAGLLRIDFGTYFEAFIMAGILLIAAAVMVLFIGAGHSGQEREIAPAAAV
ncbi:MAG: MFS transporter [Acidobacteria bacterium]|nr:MFS transporter [Acidobacteriota bacterium]MBV9479553.1 MFS transporter [Acidobacteriota bacterium]MBV9966343.1 MFS transporter [Alphaproteobacteria bacterium]